MNSSKKKRLMFYCLMSAFPILQVLIFYVFVNFNTILLVFQKFDYATGKYLWNGLNNIKQLRLDILTDPLYLISFKNSLLGWVIPFVIMTPLGLFNAYYFFRKAFLSETLKVILYIPSILSALAINILTLYFLEMIYPKIVLDIFGIKIAKGLLTGGEAFPVLIAIKMWLGFGSGILIYPAAMCAVPESVLESARIDGCGAFREFFKIVLPLIYPTITTMVVVGLTGLFKDDLGTFAFYGINVQADYYTVGLLTFIKTYRGTIADYPYLATLGLLLTLILAPIVLGVRKAMEKFGPSVD